MSPSLSPELLNLKSLCLSSYEDQDNFTRIKEWFEKKDNQVIFCSLCKEKDDFNRFWNAIQNGGKNGNFWSCVMMNEVLKQIKDIWKTPFSDFLVKYAHRNPKWDFASHYPYWEALLQSQDFFTLSVFNHPENYARTTKKESIHLLRNAQIKRLGRIQSGFDNWITPTQPYAFDWLFSKVLGQDMAGALELIEKGFKWFPLNESETHEKVKRYYGYLHDQAHLDFQKESDVQRDKVLTQQWQLLLDAGLPSLSQTQNHPKSSPGVALLEFERGGMRESPQMVSWLRFSTRPWPYAQNEENALDWAAHHGIDLNKISASILNDWMKKSIKQPERIEKLIDVLLTCSFKFKKDLLSGGSALLEKLLTTSIGTQKIEKLFELGLNPKGSLSCGESILGQIILNTPPHECLNYFKAAESWLGEDFEKTLNYKNAKGESLAHLAFRKVNLEILEQLKERGVNWNITDKKENTPGHVLANKMSTLSSEGFAKKEKYLKACVFLTQNHFNWEVKNLRGFTPFDVFNSSTTNPSLWSKIFSTIEKSRLDQSLLKEVKTKPSQLRL